MGLGKMVYEPTLLIGADGVQSTVRRRLHEWHPEGRCERRHRHSEGKGCTRHGAVATGMCGMCEHCYNFSVL